MKYGRPATVQAKLLRQVKDCFLVILVSTQCTHCTQGVSYILNLMTYVIKYSDETNEW